MRTTRPRSWRPLLLAVDPATATRLHTLEERFGRETVEVAANCGMIEVSGKWVVLTDHGASVLRACETHLKQKAAADRMMEMLVEARDTLAELDRRGEKTEFRHRLIQFISDLS